MGILIILLIALAFLFAIEIYMYGVDFLTAFLAGCGLVVALFLTIVTVSALHGYGKKHTLKSKDRYKIDEFTKTVSQSNGYKEQFQELITEVDGLPLEDTLRLLGLPEIEQLSGTTFYKFYQRFYHSKDNLVVLKIIETTWPSEHPLMHPSIDKLLVQFDIMSKDHDVISNYPWLLPI